MRGFFKTSRHRICYIYWAVPCVMWFKCHVDAMLKFHAEVPCCSAWLRLPEEMCIRISSFSCLFIHHMNHYYLHMLEFRVNHKQYTHVYTHTSDFRSTCYTFAYWNDSLQYIPPLYNFLSNHMVLIYLSLNRIHLSSFTLVTQHSPFRWPQCWHDFFSPPQLYKQTQ